MTAPGLPPFNDLVGNAHEVKAGLWEVLVQGRNPRNPARWVSRETFVREQDAEQMWMLFRVQLAGKRTGRTEVFNELFVRTEDAVLPCSSTERYGSWGLVFRVRERDGVWRIRVKKDGVIWWSIVSCASSKVMAAKRDGMRNAAKGVPVGSWAEWWAGKFEREGERDGS